MTDSTIKYCDSTDGLSEERGAHIRLGYNAFCNPFSSIDRRLDRKGPFLKIRGSAALLQERIRRLPEMFDVDEEGRNFKLRTSDIKNIITKMRDADLINYRVANFIIGQETVPDVLEHKIHDLGLTIQTEGSDTYFINQNLHKPPAKSGAYMAHKPGDQVVSDYQTALSPKDRYRPIENVVAFGEYIEKNNIQLAKLLTMGPNATSKEDKKNAVVAEALGLVIDRLDKKYERKQYEDGVIQAALNIVMGKYGQRSL